ncbi:hypothetical protein K227x_02820 [Rubripirellula lacrimiformis]|uniref:Uncharacterized protein n=1 Tax=Rubripirellula lacrimiformis TaxID=1930273 RepID=A0A517N456_9BACT|nr:hypothetical protein K227x_02820 [Rubripirellula lacrimiformis]
MILLAGLFRSAQLPAIDQKDRRWQGKKFAGRRTHDYSLGGLTTSIRLREGLPVDEVSLKNEPVQTSRAEDLRYWHLR